jgi:hypothetical protein
MRDAITPERPVRAGVVAVVPPVVEPAVETPTPPCTTCGAAMPAGMRYCTQCGAAVVGVG